MRPLRDDSHEMRQSNEAKERAGSYEVRFHGFDSMRAQAGSFWTFNRFIFETSVVGLIRNSAAAPSAP